MFSGLLLFSNATFKAVSWSEKALRSGRVQCLQFTGLLHRKTYAVSSTSEVFVAWLAREQVNFAIVDFVEGVVDHRRVLLPERPLMHWFDFSFDLMAVVEPETFRPHSCTTSARVRRMRLHWYAGHPLSDSQLCVQSSVLVSQNSVRGCQVRLSIAQCWFTSETPRHVRWSTNVVRTLIVQVWFVTLTWALASCPTTSVMSFSKVIMADTSDTLVDVAIRRAGQTAPAIEPEVPCSSMQPVGQLELILPSLALGVGGRGGQ